MKVNKAQCPLAIILSFCLVVSAVLTPVSTFAQETAKDTLSQPGKRVLRFVRPSDFLGDLDKLFLQLHPDVSFEYVDWDDEGYTGVYFPDQNPIEEFHCDDPATPTVDIYILSAVEGLHRLIREGYVLDLSSSESITTAQAAYFPQAREVLSAGGKPVAVPISMAIGAWDYNKQAWEALALPEVPKTIEGLVALLGRWNRDLILPPGTVLYGNGGWGDIRIELLMDMLRVYIIENGANNTPVNFDTPEFRNVVNEALNLPPLPYDALGTCEPLLFCDDRLYPWMLSLRDLDNKAWWQARLYNADVQLEPLLPMGFSRSKPAKVGAEMEVVCIARNSQNRDLAMEYVEFILAHQADCQEDLRAMLTLDSNEMNGIGIQKETQALYCDLVPDISFDIGALGKFLTMNDDGDYYLSLIMDGYNLMDDYIQSDTAELEASIYQKLLDLMRADINPFIAELNEEAQEIYADRY